MVVIKTLAWIVALALLGGISAFAQGRMVEASVASVSGSATLTNMTRTAALRRGDKLAVGDVIETAAGCRLVLSLSDGSQMTVYELSRVVLKDFRHVTSLRELAEVLAGRVRIKISKFGGRPNPYRVNSPTASIAVRGTEFTVDVASSGETRVAVLEGLVEVASLADPQQRRLVEPGRHVIVRPSGDISFNQIGPGGELRSQSNELSQYRPAEGSYAQRLEALELTQVIFERNVTNLIETNLRSQPATFAAFADAQFDSLLNPAYAADLTQTAGRVLQLSSSSRAFTRISGGTPQLALPEYDQNASAQLTYFTPLGARWVVGGALTVGRSRLQSLTFDEVRNDLGAGLVLTETLSGALSATNVNAALISARRIGDGRTSLGFALERWEGRSAFATHQVITLDYPRLGLGTRGELAFGARGSLGRTRFTVGLKHSLANGQKLGVFFRTGYASAHLRYRHAEQNVAFDDAPVMNEQSALATEAGALWRGAFNSWLLWGAEGLLTFERPIVQARYEQSRLAIESNARRYRFGGGLGASLRAQTLLSLDAAFGQRSAERRLPFSQRDESGRFASLHIGTQTDAARVLFFNFSATALWERGYTDNCLATFALASQTGCTSRFVNAGVGRRFTPNWAAQYLFSTDFRRRGPSHSVVFRYSFEGKERY